MTAAKTAPPVDTAFEEKNDIAQSMAIPRTIPRFSSEDEAAAPTSVLDIPDDVKANIFGYADMELEELVLQVLGLFSYPVNVDRIVLALWLNHQKKAERLAVIKRLRALAKAGAIRKVPGTKGTYEVSPARRAPAED